MMWLVCFSESCSQSAPAAARCCLAASCRQTHSTANEKPEQQHGGWRRRRLQCQRRCSARGGTRTTGSGIARTRMQFYASLELVISVLLMNSQFFLSFFPSRGVWHGLKKFWVFDFFFFSVWLSVSGWMLCLLFCNLSATRRCILTKYLIFYLICGMRIRLVNAPLIRWQCVARYKWVLIDFDWQRTHTVVYLSCNSTGQVVHFLSNSRRLWRFWVAGEGDSLVWYDIVMDCCSMPHFQSLTADKAHQNWSGENIVLDGRLVFAVFRFVDQ